MEIFVIVIVVGGGSFVCVFVVGLVVELCDVGEVEGVVMELVVVYLVVDYWVFGCCDFECGVWVE